MLIKITQTATVEIDPSNYEVRAGESTFDAVKRVEEENFDAEPQMIGEIDDYKVVVTKIED